MGRWKLRFALLLTLTFYVYSREMVKTIGSKPDATPVCTNETLSIIVLTVCKISTERSRGEECRLLYRRGQGFKHECDSRFTLLTENQTVFLHLSSLTPEDSGNYTCECAQSDGTDLLHLNITVKEDEDASSSAEMCFTDVAIGVIVFIIVTGVILAVIYRKTHHGRQLKPLASHPNMEPQNPEPYITFIQRENVLYSTAKYQRY
ncbi:uncharacterized protein LOC121627539 [Chelmon rostratus]|uniref:uncharacterized protein LOC121627539 n=1 Tax=Chelmon rostratus TaxID=109905 RepID=UPI001BEAE608|nr:uncharacterized protein LOC121627539 [Chelmon rostratus]